MSAETSRKKSFGMMNLKFKTLKLIGLIGMIAAPLIHAGSSPEYIDDKVIRKEMMKGVGDLVDAKKATSGKDLADQLNRKSCDVKLVAARKSPVDNIYDSCADSVVVIGSVYKCGKCSNWHTSGTATAWILSADGVMVTNYHVFAGKPVEGFGVRTRDGKVAPVVEILAASEKNDVAIFRVRGSGFKPLAFGPDAKVGSELHLIAHPDSRFYTYTSGKVSRYYQKYTRPEGGTPVMAITADFARGSSGGPVMDSAGNVIGMVASTQSIYYSAKKKSDKKGPFQMVIHNCVPVSSIRKLVKQK